MAQKHKAVRQALQLSEGLFSHAFDLVLWLTAYTVATGGMGHGKMGNVWRAGRDADTFLREINYRVIKNALVSAKRRLFLKTTRRNALPEITETGKRRLAAIIPQYDEKRVWDKHLHLVTYDIPETKRRDRDRLREYLRVLGCAKLQESVWLTPYDPIDTLRYFIEDQGLSGTVIVSNLGKDASIGEEDMNSLIIRLYRLEELSERYREWVARYAKKPIDQFALVQYLSILKDDPQLPFSLLPSWWQGDVAYQKVKELLAKVTFRMRPHSI